MLQKLNKLEQQYGGAIPFSSLKDSAKTKKKIKRRTLNKTKRKKRTVSPARKRRKITQKKRIKKKILKNKDKLCKCGSHKYTGKENTPTGLGKCNECLPINVVLKGKDDNLYENTKKGWIRIN